MTLPLLDGYEYVDVLGDGGTWAADQSPFRIVLHTTEGRSVDAALTVFRSQQASPHLTVDPDTGRKCQHLPLDVSAYALVNKAGGVETNREHAIQVEIVGFAAEAQDWSDDRLRFIAQVIADIRTQVDVPLTAPPFVGAEAGTIATETAPQRMSFDEWRTFAGICGHQHVPENAHWDPGHLDFDRMVSFLADRPADTTTKPQEDDVPVKMISPGNYDSGKAHAKAGTLWTTDGRSLGAAVPFPKVQEFHDVLGVELDAHGNAFIVSGEVFDALAVAAAQVTVQGGTGASAADIATELAKRLGNG